MARKLTLQSARSRLNRAKQLVQGLSESDHGLIAKTLCEEIDSCKRVKDNLNGRFSVLYELDECVEATSQVQLIEGMKSYVAPLSNPAANRIVQASVDGLLGMSPPITVRAPGLSGGDIENVALDLAVLAQEAGDFEAVRQGARDALITNCGVWRVRPYIDESPYDAVGVDSDAGKKVTRCDWEAISWFDFMCYPSWYGSFASAKTIGHRWTELLYRVKAEQRAGRFFDVDIRGGPVAPDSTTKPDRYTRDQTASPQSLVTPEDNPVEMWELIAELDLDDSGNRFRYLCTLSYDDKKLLALQPFPYTDPWYIEVRTERSRGQVFPSSSAMQRMQGIQLAYSDNLTVAIQGMFASIGPITVLSGGGIMEKFRNAKPFAVIETPSEVTVTTVSANPNLQGVEPIKQWLEELSQGVSGVSMTAQGSEPPQGHPTATQVNWEAANQQTSNNLYTQAFAPSLERAFEMILEYYRLHYDELKAAYGDRLVADKEIVENVIPTIRSLGRDGTASTFATIQKLQMFTQAMQMTLNLHAESMKTGVPLKWDIDKILERIAELLDLPFDVQTLMASQDPIDQLLDHPGVKQLLQQGVPLPNIMQQLAQAQNNPNGQSPNNPQPSGGVPPQPGMGGNPNGPGGPAEGGASGVSSPLLGGGPSSLPGAGANALPVA